MHKYIYIYIWKFKNIMKNCSSKDHENINAAIYCQKCNIYICKKCEIFHSYLFKNHHLYKIDNNINEIFTGFCQKENHKEELEFYCKTHNELCCVSCLCVLKGKGKGQHSSCDICDIEDIKEKKKIELNNNIKYLEDLSKKLEESINNLKIVYEKINEKKEKLKKKIMKIFTKLRNALNEREDRYLSDIENIFGQLFFKEDLFKTAEKLPKKVKMSLEKGKKINDVLEKSENKINLMINDCIIIEQNIKDINSLNENIKKFHNSDKNIHIAYEEKNYDEELNNLCEIIKYFGEDDKLNNVFIKQKAMEQEKLNLNKKIKELSQINDYFMSKATFNIFSRGNQVYCLDQVTPSGNQSPHLWTYSDNNGNQLFSIIKNDDETFCIKNIYSHYYIGLESINEEWKFVMRKKGENLQKFKFIYVGENYFLIQNEIGFYFDLDVNEIKDGLKIKPNIKSNSIGQQWKLVPRK